MSQVIGNDPPYFAVHLYLHQVLQALVASSTIFVNVISYWS